MPQDQELSPEAKADIQGFITTGYKHLPFSAYLLVEIREPVRARKWLKRLLPEIATSKSWREQAGAPKVTPARMLSVAFTFDGLRGLGLSEQSLCSFPSEFREGMASPERSRILGDSEESAPIRWELGGPNAPVIHAMIILNAETRQDLEACQAAQRESIEQCGAVIEHEKLVQHGERPAHGKEPFGFQDGIAQPRIKGIKGDGVSTGEFILGYHNEYQFYPASPVVPAAEDPQGILPMSNNPYHQAIGYRDFGFNGTFLIYRKLEQDVTGFWRFLQAESVRLRGTADPRFMVWLAAKMLGRWPSGAPLVLAPERDRPEFAKRNDFYYAQNDPEGLACPVGAHIRRTNPRDMIRAAGPMESLHMTARHRILRRGKPYGKDLFDLRVLDGAEDPQALRAILDLKDDGQRRGLHFLSVNASIKSQFEFVQQTWANNPHFNGLTANRDPLVGDHARPGDAPSSMLVPGCPHGLRTSPLPRFITMRGGAYFFMPSLTALRFLAEKP